jgi:hypothetical protein
MRFSAFAVMNRATFESQGFCFSGKSAYSSIDMSSRSRTPLKSRITSLRCAISLTVCTLGQSDAIRGCCSICVVISSIKKQRELQLHIFRILLKPIGISIYRMVRATSLLQYGIDEIEL